MIVIENKYEQGDIVYLVTDPEQNKRIVTGFLLEFGNLSYRLACGVNISYHTELEVSEFKNVLINQ